MRGLYVMKPSLGHTLGKIAFLFGFRDRLPDILVWNWHQKSSSTFKIVIYSFNRHLLDPCYLKTVAEALSPALSSLSVSTAHAPTSRVLPGCRASEAAPLYVAGSICSRCVNFCYTHVLPCVMHTFCPNFWGKNKDAHYTWIVLIPYLYKCY